VGPKIHLVHSQSKAANPGECPFLSRKTAFFECCATHSFGSIASGELEQCGKALLEVIMSMPVWVQVWVYWLILVNTASILFLKRVEARWVLLACMINAPLIETMLQVFGPTRILGVSHIVVWAPLVVYLWMQRGKWGGMTTWAEIWIAVLFVSNSISLVFDYVDLGRYLSENLVG